MHLKSGFVHSQKIKSIDFFIICLKVGVNIKLNEILRGLKKG